MFFNYVKAMYESDPPPIAQFHTFSRRVVSLETPTSDYWEPRLKGVNPWAFPRKAPSAADGWRTSKVVNVHKETISRFFRRYEVSTQPIAQAAWAKVLVISSKKLDVIYGQVVSGRTMAGSEKIIGPLFVSARFA